MSRIFVIAALVLAACGDNNNKAKKDDAGTDGQVADAASDAAPANPFAYCIDKPDNLVSKPPTNGLPCDLLPPAALH